ncbi:MAG: PPC domain-containing protein, partial [Pseudomonadota bacterium]
GDDLDTTLVATLPDGQVINNDDYVDFNAGFMRTLSTGGTVEVIASPFSSGETGTYRIVARTMAPAQAIALGVITEGRLSGSEADSSGARYEFTGQAGDRVAIDLKSYAFDAELTLQRADGSQLSDDDGGEEGTNSRLFYTFEEDETIILIANSLFGSEAGAFTISVTELSNEVVANFEGELTMGDTRAYDGSIIDSHQFDGNAGDAVVIELTSDDFDTVLYVSNPDGSNLAEQDDSMDGTNSIVSLTLTETGTYTLFVTSFGNDTGRYQITVR